MAQTLPAQRWKPAVQGQAGRYTCRHTLFSPFAAPIGILCPVLSAGGEEARWPKYGGALTARWPNKVKPDRGRPAPQVKVRAASLRENQPPVAGGRAKRNHRRGIGSISPTSRSRRQRTAVAPPRMATADRSWSTQDGGSGPQLVHPGWRQRTAVGPPRMSGVILPLVGWCFWPGASAHVG